MVEMEKNKILGISFNQDQGCFSCATEKGFKIFNTYPFKDTFQRDFDGGIGIVEMLYRSNILAIVGGGSKPKYPSNKVMLWDDHQMKCIGELSFKTNVLGVKLRKDMVVVVLEQKIYVYNFSDLKLLDTIETIDNPKGICCITPKDTAILICPDKQNGKAFVQNFETGQKQSYKAHDNGLSCMSISTDGSIFVTASTKGTLIRVFNTANGTQLHELRRGSDKAEIISLAIDKNRRFLACSSDKQTIHIYSLAGEKASKKESKSDESKEDKKHESPEIKNQTSVLSIFKGIIPYFDSEWSFAQFRIPDSRSYVAFGPEDKNVIIGTII